MTGLPPATFYLPMLAAGAVSLLGVAYLWPRREFREARALMTLMAAIAEWSLASGLQGIVPDLASKVLLDKISYLGIVLTPVALLVFVLLYIGREEWLTARNLALLSIFPVVTLGLAWTTELHHLIYAQMKLEVIGQVPVAVYNYGPWFWVNVCYSYAVVLVASVILVRIAFRSPHLYRMQAALLLLGVAAPWIGNVLYIFRLSPWPGLDLTPIGFVITGSTLVWGLYRYRISDISPPAHRIVLENIPDAIFVLNSQNRVVILNSAAEKIVGRSSGELIGRPVEDVFSAQPELIEVLGGLAEGDRKTVSNVGPNRRDYRVTIAPLYKKRGRMEGRLLILHDITGRQRAEAALEASEERFTLFMEHLPTLAFMKDTKGRYVFVNQAYRSILGVEPESRLGKTDDELWPPEVAEPIKENDRRVLTEGRSLEEMETVIDARGRPRTQLAYKFPVYKEGALTLVGGIALDITDRVQAEEALRESRERYHRILEASQDPVVLYDISGRVLYLNPAFTRVFGWSLDELEGKKIDFVPQETWPETTRMIEAVMRGEAFSGIETRRLTKSGDLVDVSISAAVIRDPEGNPKGSVINLRDITERKRDEAEKESLESRLRQAQKMEAVGTLAGGIAHDFNNILAAVMGYAELALLEARRGEPAPEKMELILESSAQAQTLVKQILAFSRKTESDLKPVNLNRIISQTTKILEQTLPKMIGIDRRLADDLWPVNADENQMSQVLMNLGANAGDAMPEGGSLVFKTENTHLDRKFCDQHAGADPGDYVSLAVSDTGQGMDRETVDHIFEPFYTTKGVGRGTGLGLAMAYGIVKNHNGYITCRSEIGRGTTFNIYLPARKTAAEPADSPPPLTEKATGGEETVLVVDDVAAIRDVAKQILSLHGYRTMSAENGEDALAIYRERGEEIDLILLDINMPGMGGHKCLRELLRMNPRVKVVIASGHAPEGRLQETLDLGAAGYIAKPFRMVEVLAAVRQALDG